MIRKVAIVGSHGLGGAYGGWDQLVANLCKRKSSNTCYTVIHPAENKLNSNIDGVSVVHLRIAKTSGLNSLLVDLIGLWKSRNHDTILMLGLKALPAVLVLRCLGYKFRLVANVGGVEWERPQFGKLTRRYLRWSFHIAFRLADVVVLDNRRYCSWVPVKRTADVVVIPYGGEIDETIDALSLKKVYPFVDKNYYLSISRSIEDNLIFELCECFEKMPDRILVLVSNLSSSVYGRRILTRFNGIKNIYLIDGLYEKPVLDAIRRACVGYIHTHTNCGSAPSLIEMIISSKPLFSIDRLQNRYTTNDEAVFFSSFTDLMILISQDTRGLIPKPATRELYQWSNVVNSYERVY